MHSLADKFGHLTLRTE